MSGLEGYLEANRGRRLADYCEFLRFPSVGGMPAHDADTRACAEWLAGRLRAIGLDGVELSETGGHPIVYAEWLRAPGAPTVLVYGHYDVQPVDPLEQWVKPPFDPRIEGGRIYARGAADDKGQVHLHLSALEALLAVRGRLPLNVKVVFEGEEEGASEHLDAWLEANRERLAADLAVISDSGFFEGNRPAITVGLRGVVTAEIHVYGPRLDLHSGSFGGTVENPLNALCAIVAALKGPDGRVLVPGFYDDVLPPTEGDRAALAALPFDEEAYRASTGVPALAGEAGWTVLERRGARPTLDLNGIRGGFQGDGAKTIIPADAHAKISCRLVPRQEPARVFELLRDRILALAPPGVRVEVDRYQGGRPSLTPIDRPATRAAAAALRESFGVEPLYHREGGSIPVCASFESILGLPVVLLGFTPPDDQAHAPNESMDLDNYERGIRTVIRYWELLAAGAEK
ncbi:MAG: peptidase M20 [Chloroflexi bacterium GWC2_73_18]|nr:MAG: peptidase M20 [Chloroflexi bacterium GWC2_73_18]